MEKKKRDKEATKHALFQAGLEVFAQRGYDAATTKEIAAHAGVSEALIHRYFESKAGLLLAIITFFQEEDEKGCLLSAGKGDLETVLTNYLVAWLEHCVEDADFMRVAFSRSIVDPAIRKQVSVHVMGREIPQLVERLKAFRETGDLDPKADLESIALAISSLGFTMGFLGQVVFALPAARMKRASAGIARVLARGLAKGEKRK